MNYFNPKDVVIHEVTLNYIAKAGVGFALTPENDQAFISARDIDQLNLQVGDGLRIWAVDNHASEDTSHYPSRWRAVRVELVHRMREAAAPAPAPVTLSSAPQADYEVALKAFLEERRPWTVNGITHAIAKANPTLGAVPDLLQKVGTRLSAMHRNGEAACVKVYSRSDNDRASAVYFAKNVDVFYDHLDTPLDDEE
jgi:hypothetical protein